MLIYIQCIRICGSSGSYRMRKDACICTEFVFNLCIQYIFEFNNDNIYHDNDNDNNDNNDINNDENNEYRHQYSS